MKYFIFFIFIFLFNLQVKSILIKIDKKDFLSKVIFEKYYCNSKKKYKKGSLLIKKNYLQKS